MASMHHVYTGTLSSKPLHLALQGGTVIGILYGFCVFSQSQYHAVALPGTLQGISQ